jgi:hypothetical protein
MNRTIEFINKQLKMKKLLFIVAMMLHMTSNSQSYNGIKVGQSLEITKAAVLAKGFKFIKKHTENSYTYQKKINGLLVKLHLVVTPNSNVVWKFLVYVDENTSWYDSKKSYINMMDILSKKYGAPSNTLVEWENPYYEGDGYEMQAIYLNKCKMLTFFNDEEGNFITLDIGAFTVDKTIIMIHYENKNAHKIKEKETERVNQQIY